MKKGRIPLTIACALTIWVVYVTAFHGTCFVTHSYSQDMRFIRTHYQSRQYCFGRIMWEKNWYDPSQTTNDPPSAVTLCSREEIWRGFGLLWRRKIPMD